MLALATTSIAQGSTPLVGEDHVAPIGGAVYDRFKYSVTEGAVLSEAASIRQLFRHYELDQGARFSTVDDKHFKACAIDDGSPCLIDSDGDGKFDRLLPDNAFYIGSIKLKQPVAYQKAKFEQPLQRGDFRWTITYLGAADHSLKLSYREFSDGIARPAFTEDYAIPLGDKLPQTLRVKDVSIVVTAIDGLGLHYRIAP